MNKKPDHYRLVSVNNCGNCPNHGTKDEVELGFDVDIYTYDICKKHNCYVSKSGICDDHPCFNDNEEEKEEKKDK